VSRERLRKPRGNLTARQKSAKGVVGHAVGEAIEALQCRKVEKQGRKPPLYIASLNAYRFNSVAEASEFADHFGSAPLLRPLAHSWAAFLVTDLLVQN